MKIFNTKNKFPVETQDFASLQCDNIAFLKLQQTKFHGKYRIESTRLRNYDYSSDGAYFITICTKNREHFFGAIINNEMQYTDLGKITKECWVAIPNHFPFVILDEWVVMPNHIHGIVIIDKNDDDGDDERRDAKSCVSTTMTPTTITMTATGNQFGVQSKNLASIIRGFKIGATKYARQNTNIHHVWQSRFYDHIIRNEDELNRIRQYIFNNPLNWEKDRNNKENIYI